MKVKGTDDLARLATSFNAMAVSLARQIRQLEELSRVQQRFVSDVSHELRTPLTTIRMAADLVYEDRDVLDAPSARAVELLQNQLDRFEALLVDLLEISRFDAGAAVLDLERVDLVGLVQRAIEGAQPLAERNGLDIRLVTTEETCPVDCDPRRVHRIIRNLIENAVEHGDLRGVDIRIAAERRGRRGVGARLRRGPAAGGVGPGVQPLLAGRPGPGPHHRAARAWACRSRWRTPACTVAGSRPGASPARAPASGSPSRATGRPASPSRRCPSSRPTRTPTPSRIEPVTEDAAVDLAVGVPAQSPAATFVINGGERKP